MQMWSGESQESPVLHKEPQVTKHCLRTEKKSSSGEEYSSWFSHTRWSSLKNMHTCSIIHIEQVVLYIFRNK